jgi:hypothetical protein
MANKKLWLGILIMVLVFGMTVVGCDHKTTYLQADIQPQHNKFYGNWLEGIKTFDVSFTSAEEAAGIANNSDGRFVKVGSVWYSQLRWSKALSQLKYDFTDTTYKYRTYRVDNLDDTDDDYSMEVSYTFSETEITTGSGSKPYTLIRKINAGAGFDILEWDGMVLLRYVIIVGGN